MVQLWTWDMIWRGMVIAAFMVMPCMVISWGLTHWVCSKHEHAQREILKRLQAILEECKERENHDDG